MANPIETVVRVANTPAQAKIFVAMLQAEGIPARIEGDSLTDEFAASRRLLNMLGTQVMVPTSSLARAREILQPTQVDPDELEREAMAAAPGMAPVTTTTARGIQPTTSAPSRSLSITGLLLLLATGAAVLFAFLWQQAAKMVVAPHPELAFAWDGDTARETRRRDGRLMRLFYDTDRNGTFERIEQFDASGKKVLEYDQEQTGTYARSIETHADGLMSTWTDTDRDGVPDSGVVTDRDGRVLQRIGWQPGTGYVLERN